MTRRDVVRLLALGGLASCSGSASTGSKASTTTQTSRLMPTTSTKRMPTVFLPHGGGPWPWIDSQRESYARMTAYMRTLGDALPARPSAILVVSAHWEERVATVMSAPTPPMLYDYSGFPANTYEVSWPAPGAPELAGTIESLLAAANIPSANDPSRGFDHGTFVPLSLSHPHADIPTLQLSLVAGLDPSEHLRIGRALLPLRDRGVFIVGSGMSYHNMRGFMQAMRGGPSPLEESRGFDEWLAESMALPADQRETRLVEWENAPFARACHPREEHLLPLHVIAGAAGDDLATLPYREPILGAHVSAVHFG